MSRQYHPQSRYGHVAIGYKHKVFVWGGRTKTCSPSDKSKLDSFDLRTELWVQLDVIGNPPRGLIHCASASEGPSAYVYGGGDGEMDHDTLHRLHLDELAWTRVPCEGTNSPGRKNGARMVLWNERLVLFGGYGDLPPSTDQPVVDDASKNRGLNNELHLCTISAEDGKGTWSFQPSQSVPPPCSHFSFVDIGGGKVAKYGGKEQSGRSDSLYILSLHSWTWCRVGGILPSAGVRAAHTISYVWGEQPSLLIVGGLSIGDQVSDEAWLFNLGTYSWMKVSKSNHLKRYWHSSTAFPISTTHVRVVLFGGIPKLLQNGDSFSKSSNMQNTLVADLRLAPSTSDTVPQWEFVLESNLGTKERTMINRKLFDDSSASPSGTAQMVADDDRHGYGVCGMQSLEDSEEMDKDTMCRANGDSSNGVSHLDSIQRGSLNGCMAYVDTKSDTVSGKVSSGDASKSQSVGFEHWSVQEAECRAMEAERRADDAELRAVEAEVRAMGAEKKAADVHKWSCVLQAAMETAMDRAKYWEERALRAEKMLMKAQLSSDGQRPTAFEAVKLPHSDQNGVEILVDEYSPVDADVHHESSAHDGKNDSAGVEGGMESWTVDCSNGD